MGSQVRLNVHNSGFKSAYILCKKVRKYKCGKRVLSIDKLPYQM